MTEYPSELGPGDSGSSVFTAEDWGAPGMAGQDADEALLQTEIQEAENRIALLKTEAQVLTLKRKQQATNAARLQREAEDAVVQGEEAV